jgi:alpha-ribazole phosphatase
MKLTIDLLRHGEVAGGLRLRGNRDDPLSEKGWQQMRSVIDNKALPWDHIVSSPLMRCALFAEEVAEQHNKTLQICHDFKEINFGDWEGQLVSDLYQQYPVQMNSFWNNPEKGTPPNAEPYLEFEQRIQNAWHELVKLSDAKHILLVAHGGTIRAILKIIIGFPIQSFFKIDIPNASLSRVIIEDKLPRLSFINGQLS